MAQILYWKSNHVNSNYANFKIQNVFEIKNNVLQRDGTLSSDEEIIKELFKHKKIRRHLFGWRKKKIEKKRKK